MPIRGHSGVQGGGECGVDPAKYPGGFEVNIDNTERFSELWKAPLSALPGYHTSEMVEAAHRGEIDVLYTIGGNLLETMPDPVYVREALQKIRIRVHQDIVLNTYTMMESDLLILLPAQTRYESGGTSTSTERRIRYSPPISGHDIGEARPEWQIPCLIGAQLMPEHADQFNYKTGADIRNEISIAVPIYQGIEKLSKEGDWLQWGGAQLFKDGFAKMPEGRAQFVRVPIPKNEVPEGKFYFTTRRGKQFNSMTYGKKDPLTGSRSREDVFINAADAARLRLDDGDPILLRSTVGKLRGHVRLSDIREGTLQAYWPEGNVLIERRLDPVSAEPDYNAVVEVVSATDASCPAPEPELASKS